MVEEARDLSEVSKSLRVLLPVQERWIPSLGQEDPLEKEMATHSSIPAWRIPWTEEPGGYSPWGRKESDTTEDRDLDLNICLYREIAIFMKTV